MLKVHAEHLCYWVKPNVRWLGWPALATRRRLSVAVRARDLTPSRLVLVTQRDKILLCQNLFISMDLFCGIRLRLGFV
jgi:hypothetical protein